MLCHHCREELFPKDKESEQSIYTPGLVKYKTTHHCHHLCKNHQSTHDYHVSNCAIEPLSTASHPCFIGTFLYSCWPSSFRTDDPQVSWLQNKLRPLFEILTNLCTSEQHSAIDWFGGKALMNNTIFWMNGLIWLTSLVGNRYGRIWQLLYRIILPNLTACAVYYSDLKVPCNIFSC